VSRSPRREGQGSTALDETATAHLAERGLLSDDGQRLRLTPTGMAVAGGITLRLLG
jgi:hypothetical protein